MGASATEIKNEAITQGMKTLRQSGLTKIRRGRDFSLRDFENHHGRLIMGGTFGTTAYTISSRRWWKKGLQTCILQRDHRHRYESGESFIPLMHPSLIPRSTRQILYSILTEAQKHKFEEEQELDLSFGIKGLARFRANIFIQRGALAGVFRMIPYDIVALETLGLPNT